MMIKNQQTPKKNRLKWLMFLMLFIAASAANAQISGTVYRDFNANGVKDASASYNENGLAGVTVKAYNSANALVGTTISAASGTYSFTGLTLPLRIEFSGFATGDYTGPAGSNNSSSIQFYSAANSTANFGVNYPSDYTQPNPLVIYPQVTSGNLTGNAAAFPAIFTSGYSGTGYDKYIGQSGYVAPTTITDHQTVGSLWGMAYSRQTQKAFTSAVFRRQAVLGPLGIGGIYQVDPATGTTTQWLNIETLAGIDAGTDTRDGSAGNSIPPDYNDPSYDNNAAPLVGKQSLGDIDLSDDGSVLYVVNLYQQSLVAINANTKALIGSYPITASTLGLSIPQSDLRPWGLKYYRGKVYVGVVTSAQSTQNVSDLKGYILQFDPANPGAGFSNYFSLNFDYDREQTNMLWNPWNANSIHPGGSGEEAYNPQPIISDIEFDVDGSMLLGVSDRHGFMFSSFNYGIDAAASAATNANPSTAGDILRVCNVSGSLVLEGSTGCSYTNTFGNGGEFYNDRRQGGAGNGSMRETTTGGLSFYPGTNEILTTSQDEFDVRENGLTWLNNTTGQRDRAYMVFDKDTPGSVGKTNGLGDIEIVSDAAPIEIGNRVWLDTNADGIQDAGEPSIAGVTVQLVNTGGTVIATATTDADGNYYFSNNPNGTSTSSAIYNIASLTFNTNYCVRIPNVQGGSKQAALGTNVLTLTNAGSGTNQDFIDNDGALSGNNAQTCLTTGIAGENNHTYDFGFTPAASCTKPSAGSNQTACGGTCATLTGTSPTTGTWTAMGSNASGATLGATTAGVASVCFTNASSGTYDFIYTVGTCTDTMSVVVAAKPSAGIDQTICGGNCMNITGTSNTGTWTQLSLNPGATLGSTTSGVANVCFANNASGTYNFVYTVNGCTDTMSITATPKPNAGTDKSTCYNNGNNTVTLAATGIGVWTAQTGNAGTSTITTPSNATTTVTNFSVAGTYNYIWTSGGCTDTMSVVITPSGSIGNYVWNDTNGDGLQNEPTSAGINGVTVELWNATTNTLVATTTTANNGGNPGYYNFIICNDGDYKVKFPTTVAGNGLTTQTTTASTDNNSDASTSTGFSPVFTMLLTSTGTQVNNPTIDAGYVTTPSCVKPNAGTDQIVCAGTCATLTGTNLAAGSWTAMSNNAAGATLGTTTNTTIGIISNGVVTVCFTAAAVGTYSFIYTVGACTDTMNVVVKTTSTSTTNSSVCSTALPYYWNGLAFGSAGAGTVHLTNTAGCDSAATLVLTVKSSSTSTTNVSVCSTAMPYSWNGNSYNTAGSYTIHLINAVGCDSAATLILTVKATSTSTTNVSVCSTAIPYSWNGNSYNAAGSYTVHLTNAAGCDSAATLVLAVNNAPATPTCATITVCAGVNASSAVTAAVSPSGGSITWNTGNATTATSYTYTLSNACGMASCTNTITRTPAPTTPTCAIITICSGVDATSAVMAAVTPAGGTIAWNTGNATTATYYTYTVTNSCGSLNCSNQIVRTPIPSPTCNPVTVCGAVDATTYVASSVSPVGGIINWNTGSATTATSYTYTVTNACGSVTCSNTITRLSAPATPTCAPITVCAGVDAYNPVMAVVSPNGGTIVWNTGNSSTATSYTYTLSNACGSASCTNTITRTAAPTAPTCAIITICSGVDATSAVMAAVTPVGGTIAWNTGSATTATYYTYTVTNSCGSLNCSNQIVRTPTPSSITCNPVSVCTGVDATTSVMSSVSISGGAIVWNTGNATTATSYTYTISNACGSASCTNTITRITTPATPACSPITICSNNDATAMVNAAVSPSGGTIIWLPNGSNGTTATSYTYTVSNACGSASCTNAITRTTAGSIGNYVWADTNRNGLQDEPANLGINGAYVELYMDNGTGTYTLVATTHTANDGAGNPGYYNFPICTSGNYKVKFQTNYNGGNLTTQTTTPATDGNSDADEITGYTPVIVIDINGTGTAKNNNTIDAGYKPTSVTSGGGGGVESKTLGDVIAVRLYGNAVNSVAETNVYINNIKFNNSGAIVNGANDLTLNALIPSTVVNTNAAYISTPTDLVNFTNAVEVLAVDYTQGSSTKAVAFGTKTLGDVYTHTKPICDRLKGAELMEVKNITVNGFNLMAYKVRQRTGEIEYAVNLSAGTATNRNSISLQSNWFTDSYQHDEKLYNFQLWAVSYEMVKSMATDIVTKLQANGVVNTVTNADLPKAYISKGSRQGTDLVVTVNNNTTATSGYFELHEKANENATITTRQVAFTVAANASTNVTIPVSDNYEGDIYVYLNNKLTDLVYLADGTWNVDYNKSNTSISSFDIVNESNPTTNADEYRLLRNVSVTGTSKDYITIYKTMMGGGLEQNVSDYKSIMFHTNAIGVNRVQVTLIKKSITNWNNQYTYIMDLGGDKEYGINLNQFKSSKYAQELYANDIVAVNFSFLTSRNTPTTMNINLSKARFTNTEIATTIEVKAISVYPNPSNGKFSVNFSNEVATPLVLKVVEVSTGRIVKTQFINAVKGKNQVTIAIDNTTLTSSLYTVTLEGDGAKFKDGKLMITRE